MLSRSLIAVTLLLAGAAMAAAAPPPLRLDPDGPVVAPAGVPDLAASVPDADRLPDAGLALEPPQPYRWVFAPGQAVTLSATVAPGEAGDQVSLTCWDWNLRPVGRLPLQAGSGGVTIAVSGRGTYLATLDRVRDGVCIARLARSFAICPDNRSRRALWARNGFWIGQCSFPGWQAARLVEGHAAHPEGLTEAQSRELDAELVARMGVQVARINLPVTRRDDAGMDLDFSFADQCAKAFVRQGLKLDVHLFAAQGAGRGPVLPAYAEAPEEWALVYPQQEAAFRHYVREMARRYGRWARFFQVGNEPGNPLQCRFTAPEFADTVRQAVDEVHRQFPHLPVTNGGYCSDNETVQEIIASLSGVTQFASYHYHAGLSGLIPFRRRMVELHKAAGYAPVRLANTEMGYAMPSLVAERENATQELQKLLYCWAHGDEGVLLYSSRELWWPRVFSYDGISDYGFVDHFFCPRFVYGSMSALLDHYAGFRFQRILNEDDDLHAYLFADDDRQLVAVFAPQGKTRLRVRSDARTAAVLDAMGNSRPARSVRRTTLTATDYPTTVLLEGATRVDIEKLASRSAPGL
ncbi:MAG: hypothetical protein HPY69_15005 [Armatimonadetes bacterium]|nr:hypothetical protein [Armatimonadota bacterium]